MKKGYVVGGRLVPSGPKMRRKRFHPAVGLRFHHPAPGFEAGLFLDGLSLFPTAAYVGREAKTRPRSGAPRQSRSPCPSTDPGDAPGWARGVGAGRLSTVARTSFISWRLAPSTASPNRNAPGFGQQTAFDPALTPVRGVGDRFFPPPKGDLVKAPSMLSQLQSKPFNSS